MAKITKTAVDKDLREQVFSILITCDEDIMPHYGIQKINDRQYGIILKGLDGENHYVRIGAIVAELRDDMSAEELMESEIDAYNQKQADKAEKAKAKEKKIAKDKARREAEKAKEANPDA